MAWSEDSLRKASNLIADAIYTVDDFMEDRAGPDMTEVQKAEIGVILAGASFAKLHGKVSFFRFWRLVFGAAVASKKMKDFSSDL